MTIHVSLCERKPFYLNTRISMWMALCSGRMFVVVNGNFRMAEPLEAFHFSTVWRSWWFWGARCLPRDLTTPGTNTINFFGLFHDLRLVFRFLFIFDIIKKFYFLGLNPGLFQWGPFKWLLRPLCYPDLINFVSLKLLIKSGI